MIAGQVVVVMDGHLLIVRNDLESHRHQISGADHLRLLKTARVFVVVVMVNLLLLLLLLLTAELVMWKTVRRAVTLATGARTRTLSVASAGRDPQLALVMLMERSGASIRMRQIGIVGAAGRRGAAIAAADRVVLHQDDAAL